MRIGIDTITLMWGLLIVLKFCDIVSVGWLGIIFFPVWFPFAIIAGFLAIALTFAVAVLLVATIATMFLQLFE